MQPTLLGTGGTTADPTGVQVGNYRLIEQLGAGGCGSVWLAEHVVIGARVAIKILRPEVVGVPGILDRFITEARAAATIASPRVARYVDLGRLPSGEPYAVMEYLVGETVHARLARGAMSIADALEVARQAADALAQAHAAGIVHRDIKPDNIFLVAGLRIDSRLLDFGIAKLVGDALRTAHQTEVGQFIGTPAYCAPEQLCGTSATAAMDMYALGATLFEMLTGTQPHDVEAPDFLTRKLTQPAPRVSTLRPDVPAALDDLVASMLASLPGERPASMRDVVVTLDTIALTSRTAASAVGVVPHRRPPTKLLVGALLAVLSVTAFLAVLLLTREEPSAKLQFVSLPVALEIPVTSTCPATTTAAAPAPPAASPPRRVAPRPAPTKRASDVILANPFE